MAQWNNVYNSNPGGLNGTTTGLTVPTSITGTNSIGNVLTITSANTATFAAPAIPAADSLSSVLAVGNTTGANNIVVSSPQQIGYAVGSGVRIGLNGTTVGTTTFNSIAIGNATTAAAGGAAIAIGTNAVASALSSVAIGDQAATNQIGNVCIGALASVTGTNSSALGFNATGTGAQAVVIGNNSTAGSGNNNTVCGSASFANGTTADSTIVGQGCTVTTGSTFVTQVGNAITTNGSALSNVVAIGTQGAVGGSNSVKIGRGVQGTGGFNTAVGDFITITGTSNSCLAFGQNITIPTGITGNIHLGCAQTITGTPTNSVCIGYLNTVDQANACVVGNGAGGRGGSVTSIGTNCNIGATGTNGVGVGVGANSGTGTACVAVGPTAVCGASNNSVAVGSAATTTGSSSGCISVGQSSSCNGTATDCVAIGRLATCNGAFTGCTVLGAGAVGAASNAVYLRTALTTVAAAVAVNYDTATGRLFPVTSSIRYKQDVKDFDVMHDVLQIQPKMYSFKKGHCGCGCEECDGLACGRKEIGYIAEDMAEIFPEICTYSKDAEGNRQVESIQYDRLCLLLLPELKRMRDRIDALEAK